MKKLKVLLFCALAACMSANASTFYSKATVSVESGEGRVYVSTDSSVDETLISETTHSASQSSQGAGKSSTYADQTYYLFAKAAEGYGFKQWDDGSTENPHKVTVRATSTSQGSPTQQSFTAKFERSCLLVKSSNTALGTVSVDKNINAVGDVVKMTATFVKQDKGSNEFGDTHAGRLLKFEGWFNEAGEKLSDQMTFSYTVKGEETIEARFSREFTIKTDENGNIYGYYRLETPFSTAGSYFLCMTGSFSVSISTDKRYLYGAVEFNQVPGAAYAQSDAVFADAGSVFYVTGKADMGKLHSTASRTQIASNLKAEAQGTSTSNLTGGQALSLKTAETAGYYILTSSSLSIQLTYGKRLWVTTDKPANISYKYAGDFEILPVDIDHIDNNYFGAMADQSMEFEGGYWTSMYTSFPYECYAPDGVEAYVVNATADDNGKMIAVIERLESGIVPAATPVLLKCKGLSPKENRLLPLMPDDARLADAEAAVQNNLLTGEYGLWTSVDSSTNNGTGRKTYDEASMKVFSVNSAGELGFYKLSPNADGTKRELVPNRAYLDLNKLPAEARKAGSFKVAFADISGIESVRDEVETEAPAEYFTLEGIKVANPEKGRIYIVRKGADVSKILF